MFYRILTKKISKFLENQPRLRQRFKVADMILETLLANLSYHGYFLKKSSNVSGNRWTTTSKFTPAELCLFNFTNKYKNHGKIG